MRRWGFACFLVLTSTAAPGLAANKFAIFVDDDAPPDGNGTARFPYANLQDAVAAANPSSQSVTIRAGPGDYVLGAQLLVERPVDLRGSNELIEDADGWPTGDVVAGTETRIVAANAAGAQRLLTLVDVTRSC